LTSAASTLSSACRAGLAVFSISEHDRRALRFQVRGFHSRTLPQEEIYEVIEGELEITIDGVVQIASTGLVAIVPSNIRHSVKAVTDGRVIIVDYPRRRDFDRS
jgi:mannose-6-phosphate isomerase-like protein (cupin superfamily)